MKCYIYLRTSTKEQNPELMRQSCLEFAAQKGLEVINIVVEQKSAYKGIRKDWEELIENCRKEKAHIVLSRYDRSWRNEKEFLQLMEEFYMLHGLKIYSVSETWINDIWEFTENMPNIPHPFDKMVSGIMKQMWSVLVSITGKIAEEESKKKGDSIRRATRRRNGKTYSYKGNKWGQKGFSAQTKKRVIEAHLSGMGYKKIKQTVVRYDSNGNEKELGLTTIRNWIEDHKQGCVKPELENEHENLVFGGGALISKSASPDIGEVNQKEKSKEDTEN